MYTSYRLKYPNKSSFYLKFPLLLGPFAKARGYRMVGKFYGRKPPLRERGAVHGRMENYIRDENYEIGCEAGTAMNPCGEKDFYPSRSPTGR